MPGAPSSDVGRRRTAELPVPGSSETKEVVGRVEIDTSAPFESVKEAVSRFGGSGAWRPQRKVLGTESPESIDVVDIAKVEEQSAELEKDLIVKERETLEVLKELEATRRTVEELKAKIQKEASESTATVSNSDKLKPHHATQALVPIENPVPVMTSAESTKGAPPSPELILVELQRAKVNLNRTTGDLADIQASVDSLSRKLEKEKASVQKTRERLTSNSAKISVLEEELNKTRLKLQVAKDNEMKGTDNPMDISKEIQQLSSEAEQFKRMAVAAKSEVSRTMAEIEQTKMSIQTAEIRWNAAKKMAEAAQAAEVVAFAEIKALTNGEKSVSLAYEEYLALTSKAQEADALASKRIKAAMAEVDEAERSRSAILKKVEEATEEVQSSRKAFEEALNRVEAANRGKLAVEEALRKWRSEHGQKRRSVQNSTRFKNPYPSQQRRDSWLLDLNGTNLTGDEPERMLKPTLSIGQILSRKILLAEDFEMGMMSNKSPVKPKISLGQLLGKRMGVAPPTKAEKEVGCHKQFPAKRKKNGLTRITLLLAKETMKKKKAGPGPR